jgi:hypothetical protein
MLCAKLLVAASNASFSRAQRKKLVTSTSKRPEVSGTRGILLNLSAQSRNDVVRTLGCSPVSMVSSTTAIKAGLSNHIWGLGELWEDWS